MSNNTGINIDEQMRNVTRGQMSQEKKDYQKEAEEILVRLDNYNSHFKPVEDIDYLSKAIQLSHQSGVNEGLRRASEIADSKFDIKWDDGYVNGGQMISEAIRNEMKG